MKWFLSHFSVCDECKWIIWTESKTKKKWSNFGFGELIAKAITLMNCGDSFFYSHLLVSSKEKNFYNNNKKSEIKLRKRVNINRDKRKTICYSKKQKKMNEMKWIIKKKNVRTITDQMINPYRKAKRNENEKAEKRNNNNNKW